MTSGGPATSGLLSTRTRVWIARGMSLVLVALFVALKTLDVAAVKSVSDGRRTVYAGTHLLSILFGCFGLLIFVVGTLYWMQPRRFYKAVGIVLFLSSLSLLFCAQLGGTIALS